MAINVSINKEGNITLYVNTDFIVSTDIICWQELILKDVGTEVICYGILSSECRGVSSYKDKDWKPEGKKVTYRVYSKDKQQWDKDTSKYITVNVSKDEALIYNRLSYKAKEFEGKILTGNITPWVNPFIYELDASDTANLPMIQKLTNQIALLTVHTGPYELTQANLDAMIESTAFTKKGTYSKPETEAERLQARYTFLCSQFEELFTGYDSLADLGTQISATAEGSGSLTSGQLFENSVEKTIELIKIVMGN